MSALKVGVVGVGHLGKEHARVYAGLDDVELVGVVDSDPDAARAVGRLGRAKPWASCGRTTLAPIRACIIA